MSKIFKSILILLCLVGVGCSSNSSDMIVGSWIEPIPGMSPEVQGFTLQKDGEASSINMHTLVYEKWEMIDNQTIILKGKSIGNGQTLEFSDTLKIERLDSDSLVLKQNDFRMRFARK